VNWRERVTVTEEMIHKAFIPPGSFYWIIKIPGYATFVYYGTEGDASEQVHTHSTREGVVGTKRRADPKKPRDKEMVRDEIVGIRIDRQNGGDDLPWWPGDEWV